KQGNVYLAKAYLHKKDFEAMGITSDIERDFHGVQAVSDHKVNLDVMLEDIYDVITGDIRNSAGATFSLVDICKMEDFYEQLPQEVQSKIPEADKAVRKFYASNDRISEAFARLPREKLRELTNNILRNQRGSTSYGDPHYIEGILRNLYCELTRDIKTSTEAIFTFVECCDEEKAKLPEFIREKMPSAYGAAQRSLEANKRVAKIFRRLPEEKQEEFERYSKEKE
ncbi:unnamed protein product, partial [marine sediment metagenome]